MYALKCEKRDNQHNFSSDAHEAKEKIYEDCESFKCRFSHQSSKWETNKPD